MQGIWPTSVGHIPCHFLTMVGEVGVYLSTKGTSMSAKHASSASLLHNVPCRRMSVIIRSLPGTCRCPRRSVSGTGRLGLRIRFGCSSRLNPTLRPNHPRQVVPSEPTLTTSRRPSLRSGARQRSLRSPRPKAVRSRPRSASGRRTADKTRGPLHRPA